MKKKMGLGVLGLGEGRSILAAAIASDNYVVRGICDINEKLCQERSADFGIECTTTQYDQLLEDPSIDVIAIYTPDPLHAEHVSRALKAGKHVICTKPLFDRLEGARAILQLQRESGRSVFVGQSSRFFEPMIHQRRDFLEGKLGDLHSVEAHYNHDHREYMKRTWAGGKINWLYGGLSHPVDLVRWYLPDINEVFGYGAISPAFAAMGGGRPDLLQFVFQTKTGKIGRISGCYGLPQVATERESYITCSLRGDKGASQADYYELRYNTHFEGEGARTYTFEDRFKHYFRFDGRGYHAGEFQNYIDYFAECLSEGRVALPDLAEGIGTLAVLSAMETSLRERRAVTVKEVLVREGLDELK
jgi:predicted dehydrogenase